MQLLDLVARADTPLRFTDLLKLTGQPRGSLHRQLRHLLAEGLLDLAPDGCYQPGLRLLTFASRAWARNSVRLLAEPHMVALHEATGETVHFGVLRGAEIVYLDKLESRQTVRMHSQVGNASPVYCTGIGKAALSCLSEDQLSELVGTLSMHQFTPHTLPDRTALLSQVKEIRREGYAFDLEEHQAGIRCVAAPIHVAEHDFIGGISVTAPAFRADMAQLLNWIVPVRSIAEKIAVAILYGRGPR